MSELLDTLNNRKFKRKIALSTEHCLSYIKKELVSADSSFQKSEEDGKITPEFNCYLFLLLFCDNSLHEIFRGITLSFFLHFVG